MRAAQKPAWLAARGVYCASGLKNGKPQFFAIDSNGEEIRHICMCDEIWISDDAAVLALWELLDTVDPEASTCRVLELVR